MMRKRALVPGTLVALLSACFCFNPQLSAAEALPVSRDNVSLRFEVQRAIDKGLAWLVSAQQPDGYWSTADHPAISALALVALQGDPSSENRLKKPRPEVVQKGYDFLLSLAKPDGAFFGKEELINYNTSLCVLALTLSGNSSYDPLIRKGRERIIAGQWDFDEKGVSDNLLDGGIGYGGSYPHSDVVNTTFALEALYYSKRVDADVAASERKDLNWKAAIEFLQNSQHNPARNKQDWVSTNSENLGGFIYFPGDSKAGTSEEAGGRLALRAYGSISYAGMMSYVYAGLTPDDSRVKAVLDWARHNYTLDENPGLGMQGYYFYLHMMAKALSASKERLLVTSDGREHDWAKELVLKLINLQDANGSWSNENGRWWEKDPVLASAYALIALEILYRNL
jgi:squalene-hopene/tetraprenyl-beta-curcumene cyclase